MTASIGPESPLPYDDTAFQCTDAYVDSLLDFVGTNELLRTLCGGVHILDFFTTQNPDLYSRVLPSEWRDFFAQHDITDILELLMRDDLAQFGTALISHGDVKHGNDCRWRDGPTPPESLLEYINNVRKHLLLRRLNSTQCSRNRALKPTQKLARHVAVGMNIKKVHEVGLFAHYINNLASSLASKDGTTDGSDSNNTKEITHLVDFGSGQNYLGRALASEPYNHRIVAIESRSHNAERAKEFDVMAKLATKKKIMRNKKVYRAGLESSSNASPNALPTPPPQPVESSMGTDASLDPAIEASPEAKGKIQYVEHRIQDGNLEDVIEKIDEPDPNVMVMSLHSCGNLVHHGLRSMILNPAVKVVAMVGCCYNLVTERLGPATYKLPELEPRTRDGDTNTSSISTDTTNQPGRADWNSTGFHSFRWDQGDPHGFPMSQRLCNFTDPATPSRQGIHLNITSRMMAVQAPQNWGAKDSEGFFTRHFYRALLQRLFLDKGVVGPPREDYVGGSPAGHSSGTPIIIGSLKKSCYETFVSYVRGALGKLEDDPGIGEVVREKLAGLSDEEIEGYEVRFQSRKKDLSVIWSLMAFSAGAIEAAIVVDRWLWLKEQETVREAWVESVFEYGFSPRNLVVVGVKK